MGQAISVLAIDVSALDRRLISTAIIASCQVEANGVLFSYELSSQLYTGR